MSSLVAVVVDIGIAGLAAGMLLALYRIVKGPHLADRAIAGDILALLVVGLVVLLAIDQRQAVSLDVALLVAIVGFTATILVLSVTSCFLFKGTLKSTLTKTFLFFRPMSLSKFIC